MIGDLRRMIMVNLAGCRDRFRYAGRTERNKQQRVPPVGPLGPRTGMRRQGNSRPELVRPRPMDVDTDMLIRRAGRAGCARASLLAVLLYRRDRELQQVRELGERVSALAGTGDLATRLVPDAGEGSASEIAARVDA